MNMRILVVALLACGITAMGCGDHHRRGVSVQGGTTPAPATSNDTSGTPSGSFTFNAATGR